MVLEGTSRAGLAPRELFCNCPVVGLSHIPDKEEVDGGKQRRPGRGAAAWQCHRTSLWQHRGRCWLFRDNFPEPLLAVGGSQRSQEDSRRIPGGSQDDPKEPALGV